MHGKMLWRAMRRVLVKDIPPRPVAFCGIARPQQFFLQLRVAGIDVAAEAVFRDHHRSTERDLRDLNSLRERSLGEGFVTTEKDAVNLGSHVARLQPIAFVGLKMDIVQPADALDSMLRILQERRGKHEKIVRTPS
jgi:tetraacyldisaccharide 4'-kinase